MSFDKSILVNSISSKRVDQTDKEVLQEMSRSTHSSVMYNVRHGPSNPLWSRQTTWSVMQINVSALTITQAGDLNPWTEITELRNFHCCCYCLILINDCGEIDSISWVVILHEQLFPIFERRYDTGSQSSSPTARIRLFSGGQYHHVQFHTLNGYCSWWMLRYLLCNMFESTPWIFFFRASLIFLHTPSKIF